MATLCIATQPEKPIALVVHDPMSGRIVFKGPLASIYQAWSAALSLLEGGVVTTVQKGSVLLRRKVLTTDESFLAVFLSQAVRYPYLVQELRSVALVGRLDHVADTLASRVLKT